MNGTDYHNFSFPLHRGGGGGGGRGFSTMGDISEYRGGYYDKCGDILSTVGIFSTVGDIMSTVGIFSTVGDIMSTVGGYLEYRGDTQYCVGYHDACRGYHEYCRGVQYRGGYHPL